MIYQPVLLVKYQLKDNTYIYQLQSFTNWMSNYLTDYRMVESQHYPS